MNVGLTEIRNDVQTKLNNLLTQAKSTKAMARVYSMYQALQVERFKTEGASEKMPWDPYSSQKYAEYKKKKYAKYPGSGSKLLIATSTLAGAIIGPGAPFKGIEKHRAQFLTGAMRIAVEQSGVNAEGKPFTYPQRVAQIRPFMEFSDKSINKMKEELKKFLIGK
jgi:hypothetical protein